MINKMAKLAYSIQSEDKTRAVYLRRENNKLYVLDKNKQNASDGYILFVTTDKEKAYTAWQSIGGDYSNLGIVSL